MSRLRLHRSGALCVAGLTAWLSASPASAQSVPAPVAGAATETAESRLLAQLFENVNFWSQKGQPETARSELDRVLVLAPRNPDALALAARVAFQLGDYDAGARYRNQLKAIAPNDPRLAALSAEQQLTAADKERLENARKLAAAGRKDEAIEEYGRLFQRGVPDSLAIEYYQLTSSSSPEAFRQALDGLNQVAGHWPGDMTFRLAAAELQTYREGSRSDGIDALHELSHSPTVADAARVAWRQALLWQGADFKTRDQMKAYLAENPSDPAIEAKFKDIQDSLPDEGVVERMRAYEADAAGNAQAAEAGFVAALAHDPTDAEAMIMLSIIRRRQGRLSESDQLIAKAIEISPDRRDEFVKTIGFDPATLAAQTTAAPAGDQRGGGRQASSLAAAAAGRQSAAAANRTIAAGYARLQKLLQREQFTEAEALLRKLTGRKWNSNSYAELGAIQQGEGKLPEAEQTLRRAVADDPNNANAMSALASVLIRLGARAETPDLIARARAVYVRIGDQQGLASLDRDAAEHVRAQAQDNGGGAATQVPGLRAAHALDPSNPWIRLDLAHALQQAGLLGEAQQLMAASTNSPHPSDATLMAGIYWAQGNGQVAEAASLVQRLPPALRTPALTSIETQATVRGEIARARASGNSQAVRAAMIAIAAEPDSTGLRANAVALALVASDDKPGARQAIATALARTGQPTSSQRIRYAEALTSAGYAADAQSIASQVDPNSIPRGERQTFDRLQNSIAIGRAERLAQAGDRAQAFDALQPRLQADPSSAGLNLAVSRLYQSDGQPQKAVSVARGVLQRDPTNLETRSAVVSAAIQAGDYALASQLAGETVAQAPGDPRGYLMQAQIARARGASGEALTALRRARALRLEQLRTTGDRGSG